MAKTIPVDAASRDSCKADSVKVVTQSFSASHAVACATLFARGMRRLNARQEVGQTVYRTPKANWQLRGVERRRRADLPCRKEMGQGAAGDGASLAVLERLGRAPIAAALGEEFLRDTRGGLRTTGGGRASGAGARGDGFIAELQMPVLYLYFPLEFALLLAARSSFGNSDLLLSEPKIREITKLHAELVNDITAAVSGEGDFWPLSGKFNIEQLH